MKLFSQPATERWMEEILRIERESFPDPWTEEAFRAEFGNRWSYFRLALTRHPEPLLLGYIVCWIIPEELHLLNLAVAPAHRRRGVATFLLHEALGKLAANGGGVASLEVRPSNLAAQGLYQSLGFEVVGRRPAYYRYAGEDALLMSLKVLPEKEYGKCSR